MALPFNNRSNRLKRPFEEISSIMPEPAYDAQVTHPREVQARIKTEMLNCVFANRPEFVDTFFNNVEEKRCNDILNSLTKKGLYRPKSRRRKAPYWTSLPRKPRNETSLYRPLVNILNAISELEGSTHDDLRLVWRDVHKSTPNAIAYESRDEMCPDIIAEHVGSEPEVTSWWYRIAILVELKKITGYDGHPTLLQLLRNARQIFKEQPFRRAGVVGSFMFNIHEDPLTLIKCIASCSAMDPVGHGFGPIFRAYDAALKTAYMPWMIPRSLLDPGVSKTLTKAQWVVEIPTNHRKGGDQREEFVLFDLISLNLAEVLKGRAGRIWLARKRSDLEHKQPCKTFVFKDNWHDARRMSEGAMYEAEGDVEGVAKLYSYETVQIKDVDDSTSHARRGLEVPANTKPTSFQRRRYPTPQEVEAYYNAQRHSNPSPVDGKELGPWLDMLQVGKVPHPIHHHDHQRLLLSSYGYPITDFVSREELAVVFQDAVNGHRILESPNKGLLIDQDYTVANFDNHAEAAGNTRTGTPAFMAVELLTSRPMFCYDAMLHTAALQETGREGDNSLSEGTAINYSELTRSIYHKPVHDLESFLWLLCWICLTRAGPSTERKYDPDSERDRNARSLIEKLFEEEYMLRLGQNKRELFQCPLQFGFAISQSVAPYFTCFVNLIISLQITLFVAYRDRKYEGLHNKFIEKIELFRKTLEDAQIPAVEGEQMMIENSRKRRSSHTVYVIPELPVVQQNAEGCEPNLHTQRGEDELGLPLGCSISRIRKKRKIEL
ncbi:hypothetical protein ABKN59_011328 [Abortiporus biennis]